MAYNDDVSRTKIQTKLLTCFSCCLTRILSIFFLLFQREELPRTLIHYCLEGINAAQMSLYRASHLNKQANSSWFHAELELQNLT